MGQFFLKPQLLYVFKKSHNRHHWRLKRISKSFFIRQVWWPSLYYRRVGTVFCLPVSFSLFVQYSRLLFPPNNSFHGAHHFAAFATQNQFVKHHYHQLLPLALPSLWNDTTRITTGLALQWLFPSPIAPPKNRIEERGTFYLSAILIIGSLGKSGWKGLQEVSSPSSCRVTYEIRTGYLGFYWIRFWKSPRMEGCKTSPGNLFHWLSSWWKHNYIWVCSYWNIPLG